MTTRDRSVSPLGASRFERPYTPMSSKTSPRSATSHRDYYSKPSFSKWSASDSQGCSTAPSSIFEVSEQERTPAAAVAAAAASTKAAAAAAAAATTTTTTAATTSTVAAVTVAARDTTVARRAEAVDKDELPHHHHHHHHPEEHDEEMVDQWSSDEWFAHVEADDDVNTETIGDECPDRATLAATYDIPVYSSDGQALSFGSLHDPATSLNQRQLFVFIRHFYCGACQAYVKALSQSITLQEYFAIPIPTSIIVIGCGQPHLIPFYKEVTGTCFPVFAEPSRQLYKMFGMVLTTKFGSGRPDYMRDTSTQAWLAGQVTTIRRGLRARKEAKKIGRMISTSNLSSMTPRSSIGASSDDAQQRQYQYQEEAGGDYQDLQLSELRRNEAAAKALSIRKRDIIRGGNPLQTGGEFLFEDGEIIWCHRMRHYRDHVEVPDIRRLLDLDE